MGLGGNLSSHFEVHTEQAGKTVAIDHVAVGCIAIDINPVNAINQQLLEKQTAIKKELATLAQYGAFTAVDSQSRSESSQLD